MQGTADREQGDPEAVGPDGAGPDPGEADTLAATLPETTLPDTPHDAPVEAAAPLRPWRRRSWQRRAFQALCVACVAVLLPISAVRVIGDEYVRSVQDVPAEPVGIVFGASVVGDVPSPYLASRLDVAIALWRAGKIKVFLVTGDHADADYDEPQAMRDYLVRHGVPVALIVQDGAGYDTWQSCVRAKQVFGVEDAIVVSQSFHVPRAAFLCRAAGITAYGVGDGDAAWRISPDEDMHDTFREVLAGFNAVYQGTVKPAPQVSTGPAGAIAQALRAAG